MTVLMSGAEVGPPAADRIRTNVQPGDMALVVNFQQGSTLLPPDGAPSWRELGFSRVIKAPFARDEDLLERLQRPVSGSAEQRAWESCRHELTQALTELGAGGRVHVFAQGPYGVGATLGKLLREQLRGRQPFLYQWDEPTQAWMLFFRPEGGVERTGAPDYYRELEVVPDAGTRGGRGYALCILSPRLAPDPMLQALARQEGLVAAYRLQPQGPPMIDTPARADRVRRELEAHLTDLYERHRGHPLHLCTSAPLALMIRLAAAFRRNVYPAVIVHQLNAARDAYYPVVDIGGDGPRPVAAAASIDRPRLQIFQGDEALLFRLNDELLPLGKPIPPAECGDGIARRGGDEDQLTAQARAFTRRVLPRELEALLIAYDAMDIEVDLRGAAANLPWEFLTPFEHDFPFAARPGWTLTRRVGADLAGRGDRKGAMKIPPAPAPGEPVRVLIAPVLAADEAPQFAEYHRLPELKAKLEAAGAQVELLRYGASAEQVKAALAAQRPHLLHWIGHGGPDRLEATPAVAQLELDGHQRGIDRVELPLLLGEHMPRVALLGACDLGHTAQEFGVPDNLHELEAGVVISFRDRVAAGELGRFCDAFYDAVLEGASIAAAVQRGRVALRLFAQSLNRLPGAFGNPVLTFRHPDALGPLLPTAQAHGLDQVDPGHRGGTPLELVPDLEGPARTAVAGTEPGGEAGHAPDAGPGQTLVGDPEGPDHPIGVGPFGPELPLSSDPTGPDHLAGVDPFGPELPLSSDPTGPDHLTGVDPFGPELPLSSDPTGPDHLTGSSGASGNPKRP